jgi:hypothetical protein
MTRFNCAIKNKLYIQHVLVGPTKKHPRLYTPRFNCPVKNSPAARARNRRVLPEVRAEPAQKRAHLPPFRAFSRLFAEAPIRVDNHSMIRYFYSMPRKIPETPKPAAGALETEFRSLIQKCIDTYAEFNDDTLTLDFNRITDTKLRAMILQDPLYRQETRFLRAHKIMDSIHEMDELGRIAASMYEGEEEEYDVRGGKQKKKRPAGADKDMLNMRFKAAQERRALLSEINKSEGDELDAVNFFFIPVSREDFERLETVEIYEERDADDSGALDALAGSLKEKLPESGQVSDIRPVRGSGAPQFTYDEEGRIVLC